MQNLTLTELLTTKFNIENPKVVLRHLKDNGFTDTRRLRNVLNAVSVERFDVEKLVDYNNWLNNYSGANVTLTYNVDYWMLKLNISKSEAAEIVETKKRDKTTSKQGFIKRHGVKNGTSLFKKFQQSSKSSSDDKWFQDRYGNNWKTAKETLYKERSKRCVEFWIKKGYSLLEAKVKVAEYQLNTAGVNLSYYLNNGYTNDEADLIIKKINKSKANHKRNVKFLQKKYPNNWQEIYLKNASDYRRNMEEKGLWIASDLLSEYQKYHRLVWMYTNQTIKTNEIKNLHVRGVDWHLDHKYSIKMGFINDIPAEIIGAVINLEIIPCVENCKKRAKCSISKPALLTEYKKLKGKRNES